MENLVEVVNKTLIEIALQIDDEGFTTAKKLYTWLELNPAHYARWAKENITENPFAEENEFSPLMVKTSKTGREANRGLPNNRFLGKINFYSKNQV